MIKLINGDCLEELKKIKNNSVNLVLIDPPYNIGKDTWDKWKTVKLYVEFLEKVFLELQRVLKDNGSFYFFHNDFMQIVEIQNMINKKTNFIFKQLLTMNKKKFKVFAWKNRGEKCKDRNWFPNIEYCLFYTLQDETGLNKIMPLCFKKYLNYMTEQKELLKWNNKQFNDFLNYKSISSHWFWQNKEKTKQSQPRFIKESDYNKLKSTGFFKKEYEELRKEYEELRYIFNKEHLEDISCVFDWENSNSGKEHSCSKPIDILEKLILTSSNEGDVVLDCFMGSGSTGVACNNLNRSFIGIEIDEEYFKIAEKRIKES